MHLFDLPVTRIDVPLTPLVPMRWPPSPAWTLRGALGRAVMRVACVHDAPPDTCAGCREVHRCPVSTWYERARCGGQDPRPFALHAWPEGDVMRLRWTFFGEVTHPALVRVALRRAMAVGLGPDRVPHAAGDLALDARLLRGWLAPVPDGPLSVRFVSRVSLGGPDRPPTAEQVVKAAISRVRAVGRVVGAELAPRWPDVPSLRTAWSDWTWQPHARTSRRQGEPIPNAGGIGVLHLGEDAAPFHDLLAAMTVLQLGKGTSEGNGVVELGPTFL